MNHWGVPQTAILPGDRLHLQHGPIDLVIKAEGLPVDARRAHEVAFDRFRSVLTELVAELPLLRRPLQHAKPETQSPIADRMIAACWPYRDVFITPMAAVAGAVADEIKSVMLTASPDLQTLYVNNGGDIAVHVADHAVLKIGVVPDLARAIPTGMIRVDRASGIGGIATSGWRGRSFSLGIADAVTAVAATAADADAAATVIANAVNADGAAIRRTPARSLDPDSDLADLPVTTDVGILEPEILALALAAGKQAAIRLKDHGQILGAALMVQNEWEVVEKRSGLLMPVP